MSDDVLRAALGLFAVLAPFGGVRPFVTIMTAARGQPEAVAYGRHAVLGGLAALGVLALAAVIADPFLDAIDVSGASFEFAAAAAMTPLAGKLLLDGDSMVAPERSGRWAWLIPLGFPLIANPSALVAMVAYSGRYGEGDAILAAAIAVALTAAVLAATPRVMRYAGSFGAGMLGRLSGALLVAIAVSLAVSGVHNV